MMGSDVQVCVVPAPAPAPAPGALGLDIPSSLSSYAPSSIPSPSQTATDLSDEEGSDEDLDDEPIAWPAPPNEKTLWAMVEILDSEDKFVGLLKRLVDVYLAKLPPVLSASGAALLARNSGMVLESHTRLVNELKSHKGNRSGLCQVLTSYASELTSLHQEFSAGHAAAKSLLNRHQVRDPQIWAIWEKERADESGPETDGSRSRSFEDLLIAPIQRVCKYHLLVSSLRDGTEEPEVADAIAAMQAVAASVDEIVRVRADEDRVKVVLDRMDPIPGLPSGFLASLGPCLLIGTLDVIYYEASKPQLVTTNSFSTVTSTGSLASVPTPTPSSTHPLLASGKPQKAKHLAAFLWTGYLVLCKVHTKRTRYEPKRWFPLKIVPNSSSLTLLPNPSSTVIDSGVSDCDASSSDASPLFPETHLPPVSTQPVQQQLAPPVIQQLQPKKSFGHIRTKSQSQSQPQSIDEPAPTLRLGHVQVQPSDQVFPYGIRISFSRHVFELGASCEEERDIWVRAITDARVGNELVLAERGRAIARSKSNGTITASISDDKALVVARERERSGRERSKSRERGALSARDKSREPSREPSREDGSRDDRSTIRGDDRSTRDDRTVRDDRSTRDDRPTRDDRSVRDDKPLPPAPPPTLQRKKSSGVLVPQDGPVQIGNWIVQRLETVTTPSGTTVSGPATVSHTRSGSEYTRSSDTHTTRNSEATRSSDSHLSHARNPSEISHRNPSDMSHSRNASEYSVPYSNPYANPERAANESTGGGGIGERLENAFLRPRYGHGYGYAAAGASNSQQQGGPYVGPSGQYVGPSGYSSLTRESSQSSSATGYTSSTSTATLTNYARSEAPSGYARSEAPSGYARSEAPSYARSEAPGYARSEAPPSNYAPSTVTPSNYASSNYARSEAASNYARSDHTSNYAPSINTPSTMSYSSNSSTPFASQASTPASHGPNFAGGYTSRFQTRSRTNESSLAANLERKFITSSSHLPVERTHSGPPLERTHSGPPVERPNPSTGASLDRNTTSLGANVRRTNSSSTGGSRSFPPSPVATAPPALPVQPTQLTPQQVVRRPSNNTRDPVIMALADVISSSCREARDRASVRRKPLWMTPEEAAAAAEKEREKAANGMMGMVRPRRMSSALVGSKSKTAEKDKDKEKDKEKDKAGEKEKEKKRTAPTTVVRPSSSEGVVVVPGEPSNKTSLQRKRATIHGGMHAFPSMGPPSPERETKALSAHGHGTPSTQVVVAAPVQQAPQPPPKPPSMHMRGASEGPISPPRSRTVSSSGSFVGDVRDFLLRRAFAKSAENMALPAPVHDPPNPVYTVGAGLTNTKSEEGLPRANPNKSGSVPVPQPSSSSAQAPELYALGAGITNTDPPPKRKPRISLRSSSAGSAFFARLTGSKRGSKDSSTPMSSLTFTPMSEKDRTESQAAARARESRSRSNEYYRRMSPNQGGPPNRNMLGAEL
ncbi:unnamed protein product, partial [Rhizoctonia solani]